ncbi:hypothetical protein WH47_06580 [Habropoda laboriosa]|uniref:Uncharacterized protein n=1 Tax=Habropoda laboriosa TaxID=597456 RepID=A0A0L7RD54_9HYME|nr:hypothetical protein WH47_06580 [Habropoda laboriosa]
MSEKEGDESAVANERIGKSEEMGEESPANLETIPTETVRNGVQVTSMDKAKSKRVQYCYLQQIESML